MTQHSDRVPPPCGVAVANTAGRSQSFFEHDVIQQDDGGLSLVAHGNRIDERLLGTYRCDFDRYIGPVGFHVDARLLTAIALIAWGYGDFAVLQGRSHAHGQLGKDRWRKCLSIINVKPFPLPQVVDTNACSLETTFGYFGIRCSSPWIHGPTNLVDAAIVVIEYDTRWLENAGASRRWMLIGELRSQIEDRSFRLGVGEHPWTLENFSLCAGNPKDAARGTRSKGLVVIQDVPCSTASLHRAPDRIVIRSVVGVSYGDPMIDELESNI